MEPYRPIVDLYVAEQIPPTGTEDLRPTDKLGLIALLNVDVVMPRGTMSVLASVEQAAESLARLFDGGSEQVLEMPKIIGLQQHRPEM